MYHIKHYGEDHLPKNGKLLAKKSSIAHQNAPLDYISPWQAQHHIHLINSHNGENIQYKNKSSQQKQKVDNVVSSFLQKVRRSSKLRGKQLKLAQNFSLDQQEHSTNNNSSMATPNTYNNTPIMRKIKKQGLIKNRTYDQPNSEKQRTNTEGAQNVGFGFLKYSKHNLQKQYSFLSENNEVQRKIDMISCQSQNRKFSQIKNSPTFYCHTQKQQQQLIDNVDIKFRDQIVFLSNNKLVNSRKRIFTQQQKQRPEQVIFVKKKKQNNKMTVVDINSTAQQFYDEEIKYIQDNMTKKYGKKAKSQIGRNQRYFTQETMKYNQTIFRASIQRSLIRNKMNQTGYAHQIISKRKIM